MLKDIKGIDKGVCDVVSLQRNYEQINKMSINYKKRLKIYYYGI